MIKRICFFNFYSIIAYLLCSTSALAITQVDLVDNARISLLIKSKDWQQLEIELPVYQQTEDYNDILFLYAEGALARQQKKYDQALKNYRKIMSIDHSLIYVRFDYALMLIENKQFQEAEQQLRQIASSHQLDPYFKRHIEQLIDKTQRQSKWNISTNLQYLYNDNVNNASDIEVFKAFCQPNLGCLELSKPDESLPKKDHALHYGIHGEKNKNINKQHYVVTGYNIYGLHYFKEKEFNETTSQIQLGYRYQNIAHDFSVIPFYQYTWLGSDAYLTALGSRIQYKYWINSNVLGSISHTYLSKNYFDDDLSQRYDGHLNQTALSFTYLHQPSLIFFGGVEAQRDELKAQMESSNKKGVSLGIFTELGLGINLKMSSSYARKSFDTASYLGSVVGLNKARTDNEFVQELSVWHRDFQYLGIYPKINAIYQKTDSNLDMFYSKKSSQIFISFEKNIW